MRSSAFAPSLALFATIGFVSLACAVGACASDAVRMGARRPWMLANLPPEADTEALCEVETEGAADGDHDGLPDPCEDALAQRFAPVVVHSTDESNLPTNVDAFLRETSLAFHDDSCGDAPDTVVARAPTEADLGHRQMASRCQAKGEQVTSSGSRSLHKHRTFYLADVGGDERRGSGDSRDWTTYVHAYPNDVGGVTLQYWRFYAYNDAFNNHGGDWEGLHIVLDPHATVVSVRLLQHGGSVDLTPRDLEWVGTHVIVFSEGGGHATRQSGVGILARDCDLDPCVVSLDDRASYIWQETWLGGKVSWPDGTVTSGGGLVNMGEKSAPLNGQLFVQYSGLWGSPGIFYWSSGYWGPSYNETGMTADGFISSWCAGMAGALDRRRECWPADSEP
jgi:hypothetical protein